MINLKLKNYRRFFTILLHLVAWGVFVFYPFIFFQIQVYGSEFYYKQVINTAFLAGAFYFSTYYLFPRLIDRKKMVKQFCLLGLIIVLIPFQQYLLEYYFSSQFENHVQVISPLTKIKIAEFHSITPERNVRMIITHRDSLSPDKFFNLPFPPHSVFVMETIRKSISSILFILLMSGFVSLARQLFRTEKQKKELETQRLNSELAFLKSQVNPHFFFNTLNTIYLLARKKSNQTEQVVVKLSEIMRYMIYESNVTEVSLSREIKYLNDYIDLQRLRLSKKVAVEFEINGEPDNLQIAPMLLIPFIENAFKHGISYIDESFVLIRLSIAEHAITFTCKNKSFPRTDVLEQPTGVGLENVQKRLALLYPEKHTLQINQENKEFEVSLFIRL